MNVFSVLRNTKETSAPLPLTRQEGIQQSEAAVVRHLIERRFGPISPAYAKKIGIADTETLLLWIDRLVDAQSLEDVF